MGINNIRNILNDPRTASIFIGVSVVLILIILLFKGNEENKVKVESMHLSMLQSNSLKVTGKSTSLTAYSYHKRNPFHRNRDIQLSDTKGGSDDKTDDLDNIDISFILDNGSKSFVLIDNVKYKVGSRFKRYNINSIMRSGIEFVDTKNNIYFVNMY